MAIPEPFKFVFPIGKKVRHFVVADELVSGFVFCILQSQRLVVDKTARACKTEHGPLLFFARH